MDVKTPPTPPTEVCCLYCNQPSKSAWVQADVHYNVCPPCMEDKDVAGKVEKQLELALNVIYGVTDTANFRIDELMRGLVAQRWKYPEVEKFTLMLFTAPGKPGLVQFYWRPEAPESEPTRH